MPVRITCDKPHVNCTSQHTIASVYIVLIARYWRNFKLKATFRYLPF